MWFRNDLRVDDNPALNYAITNNCQKAIVFISKEQWQQHQIAPIKQDLIERHIHLLTWQLQQIGIDLMTVHAGNFQDQIDYLKHYTVNHNIQNIAANSELELNEQLRDQKVKETIKLRLFEADTLIPKGSVLNQQGKMYHVFSAFKKACWRQPLFISPTKLNKPIPIYQEPRPRGLSAKWPLADAALQQFQRQFCSTKLANYGQHRDIPSLKGTSGLSPYLAIGAISVRLLWSLVVEHYRDNGDEAAICDDVWLSELLWREFYRHLLFHQPSLIKGHSFKANYQKMPWPNSAQLFNAWQQGKTGFPIIDAAIQQLLTTGWMHNRLRMICASFLTKHCLVDWRLGERFFIKHLIDGDFAANNGGWQWSAGTGCDAQPYFRIFNPVNQSKKFDPEGIFIRRYLPQLKDVPTKEIHQPYHYLASTQQQHLYWPEIVDLSIARKQALLFFKENISDP